MGIEDTLNWSMDFRSEPQDAIDCARTALERKPNYNCKFPNAAESNCPYFNAGLCSITDDMLKEANTHRLYVAKQLERRTLKSSKMKSTYQG